MKLQWLRDTGSDYFFNHCPQTSLDYDEKS